MAWGRWAGADFQTRWQKSASIELAGIRKEKRIRPADMVTRRFLLHARDVGIFRDMLGSRFGEYGHNGFKDLLHKVLLLGGQ
jgi:hypothetical protein